MKKHLIIVFLTIITFVSCNKFLEEKPDAKVSTPDNLQDLDALLNNESRVNYNFCPLIEMATDDIQLYKTSFLLRTEFDKDIYTWEPYPFYLPINLNESWGLLYSTILYANVALDGLTRIKGGDQNLRNKIKGDALFLRAYRFYNLAQAFAPTYMYNDPSNNNKLGIPLRLTANPAIQTKRNTLEETYQQIIGDLKQAIDLLPENVSIKTRPNKLAAYALLSRVLLAVEDYHGALQMAQECLSRNTNLLDYNNLNRTVSYPFEKLNDEVIYHSICNTGDYLFPTINDVTEDLYNLYSDKDLRKTAFFGQRTVDRIRFKGFYNGGAAGYFAGLATDEVYLNAAECQIRLNQRNEGMATLNKLLVRRYDQASFVPRTAKTDLEALTLVLEERRRELPFRGTRWTDLRRLNKDPRFSTTISKSIPQADGTMTNISLPPNDLRYTFLIPQGLIEQTGMVQNPR
ncbi:RagB/SusD family nutrient uptake outer membrane protein [Sphingobacterium sp.]|uniref:RagB/SusD family nutrient uptake outer membrane protein n=1 Tax=Sphingobacterium sp. TaxID=341027 RepID=UPI00289E5F2D|nr:RagB/SusD family nutrient uptake outer membrane protein [Sphingobacterium sp.]